MNFKLILAAAAMSLAATAASAITHLVEGDSGSTFDILADAYQFQGVFPNGTPGNTLAFTFENTSMTDAIVTISSATINQNTFAYFTGGASVDWTTAGNVTSAAQAASSGGNLSFILGAGASDTLNLTFGIVVASNGLEPDLDFLVTTAPVPVPAGILLMGTALAGFGVMRRKAKKAA